MSDKYSISKQENCVSSEEATAKIFQAMLIKSSEFGDELSPEEQSFNDGLRKAVEIIRSLPPATPQIQEGEWTLVAIKNISHSMKICECSICHKRTYGSQDFCPHCGSYNAGMRERQKIDCQNTNCENCVNHKYCDYEGE